MMEEAHPQEGTMEWVKQGAMRAQAVGRLQEVVAQIEVLVTKWGLDLGVKDK